MTCYHRHFFTCSSRCSNTLGLLDNLRRSAMYFSVMLHNSMVDCLRCCLKTDSSYMPLDMPMQICSWKFNTFRMAFLTSKKEPSFRLSLGEFVYSSMFISGCSWTFLTTFIALVSSSFSIDRSNRAIVACFLAISLDDLMEKNATKAAVPAIINGTAMLEFSTVHCSTVLTGSGTLGANPQIFFVKVSHELSPNFFYKRLFVC